MVPGQGKEKRGCEGLYFVVVCVGMFQLQYWKQQRHGQERECVMPQEHECGARPTFVYDLLDASGPRRHGGHCDRERTTLVIHEC